LAKLDKEERNPMNNKTIIFVVMVSMIFAVSAASADNVVYLDPSDIDIPDCGTTEVSLMLNSSDAVGGFQADIKFDPAIAKITAVTFAGNYANMFSSATDYTSYFRLTGVNMAGDTAGEHTLATLTIECVACDGESALIEFTEEFGFGHYIANATGGKPPATWTGGTVTCGEPDGDCLGTCYDGTVCEGTSLGKMSCSECLAVAGRSWLNDPCPVSACGCTCDSMCWNDSIGGCPECCDGIDNDGVDGTDWPNDPKCACCIDLNETLDDGCSTPCVPELPTLALAGIGILGIALLARKRD
jgi:hypothetical protein